MTFKEYFSKNLGKSIEFDGVYPYQCCDLANDYMQKCFNIFTYYPYNFNAQQYFTRFNEVSALVKNFTKIANTPEFVPMQGDICIFKSSDNIGHISVATGEGDTRHFYSYDQNWNGHSFVAKEKHTYTNFLGVLRYKGNALDITGLKRGDNNAGVLAFKMLLKLAKVCKIINTGVDFNGIFGKGTEKATNEILRKLKKKENGIAGTKLITELYRAIYDEIVGF